MGFSLRSSTTPLSIQTELISVVYTCVTPPPTYPPHNSQRDGSMLTWESNQILGVNSILEKLESLPFQKVAHKTDTIDAQPSSGSVASLLVLVTGQLMVDDSPNPIPFSQVFQLMPEDGSYYVQNDVFRLVYG
ncbi:hypothetical protein E3P78_00343 [Wallemia ichthyophaga]|nr:hypothetical protein E3P78_00343 [Wallemia ichthyophaga]